jgi:hypothetical protein
MKDRILQKHICELILDIKSIADPTKKCFLFIAKGHKNKAVIILTVFPQMEEEASIPMATLLPYLSHFYPGKCVAKYLTPNEIERCKDCYWDVVTKQNDLRPFIYHYRTIQQKRSLDSTSMALWA